MEKQILEILMDLEKGLTDFRDDLARVQNVLTGVQKDLSGVQKDLKEVKADVQEVKETVNRIEISHSEDVIGILKENKRRTDFEIEYLNHRVLEMDKRIYFPEKT